MTPLSSFSKYGHFWIQKLGLQNAANQWYAVAVCSGYMLHAVVLAQKIPLESSLVRPDVLCLRTEPLCPVAL